ncbi:MAG: PqqD family protein [Bacillota bacterium]|nr:PqqD family protein [Bacillota bacterium]
MVYKFAEGVEIVHSESGDYIVKGGQKFMVYGSAIEFLKLIDGKRDMDQILRELVKIYGPSVEPYIIARDLEKFIYDLVEEGIVVLVKTFYDDKRN